MNDEIEARLTIEPPPAWRIAGTTCLATKAGPMMLMSSIGRHSSGVASIPLRMKIAALFTRTWIAPKAATASAAMCATLASSDTSVRTNSAFPPAWLICWAAARPVDSSRSAITTAAPSSANRSAVARPIPAPAPVITATLAFNRFMAVFSLVKSGGSNTGTDRYSQHYSSSRASSSLAQEGNQVGHVLEADGLFESLGHQGFPGGPE